MSGYSHPGQLPPKDELIAAAREAMAGVKGKAARRAAARRALNQYAPAIDQLADVAAATEFMGFARGTIARISQRIREDGSREWPEPDLRVGGRPAWKYRSIVICRAEAPVNRGQAGGMARARQRTAKAST
jgi:hypothetical protein